MDNVVEEKDNKNFNKEVAEAEVSLFENVIGKKLNLKIDKNMPTSATDGKTIYINPNSEIIDSPKDVHTMLNHEEGHILFKSNKYVPELVSKNFPKVPKQTVFTVYNILEDIRIEDNMGRMLKGSTSGFEKLRHKVINTQPTDPIGVLGVVRAEKPELMKNAPQDLKDIYEKFKEQAELLHGANFVGTFPVEVEIMKEMKKWYEEKIKKENKKKNDEEKPRFGGKKEKENNEEKQEGNKENESKKEQEGLGEGKENKEEKQGLGSDKEEKQGSESKGEEEQEEMEKDTENYKKKDKLSDSETSVEMEDDSSLKDVLEKILKNAGIINEEGKLENYDKDKLKKLLDENKVDSYTGTTNQQVQIKKNFDKKLGISKGDVFKKEDEETSFSSIPTSIISQIKSVINILNQKEVQDEVMSGGKINTKRAIEKIISPNKEVSPFIAHAQKYGTDFYILLDLSGSMHNYTRGTGNSRIENAKQALAKIYDTIKSSKTPINLKMFGFGTHRAGNEDVPIVFEFDRKRLNTLRVHGSTPTAHALKYMLELFKKNGDNEKNLIIITDGVPMFSKSLKLASQRERGEEEYNYYKLTKEEVKKLKQHGVNVFTIFLGDIEDVQKEITRQFKDVNIQEMFGSKSGKNVYSIEKSEDINPVLTKIFKKEIMNRIRS